MKKRWSGTTWVLVILSTLLVVIAIDVGRQVVTGGPVAGEILDQPKPDLGPTPLFGKGDPAPDFTLADAKGQKHSLYQLLRGDTLLQFNCGCGACRSMSRFVGVLYEKLGPKAPAVVTVTTAPPESEAAWIRDTKLAQTVLYEQKGGPVMEQYRGHPCPRVYRLDGDRNIRFIGPSPTQLPDMKVMGLAVGKELGFGTKEVDQVEKLLAKENEGLAQHKGNPGVPPPMTPTSTQIQPAPAAGHSPGDGHGH